MGDINTYFQLNVFKKTPLTSLNFVKTSLQLAVFLRTKFPTPGPTSSISNCTNKRIAIPILPLLDHIYRAPSQAHRI